MSNYYGKKELVMGRQLQVQKLTIPFTIVGSATAANVAPRADEPALLSIRTAGVDQITGALGSGDVAPTFGDSPSDANGVFNAMVSVGEQIQKVCDVRLSRRGATIATAGPQVVSLGTSSGIVQLTAGGNSDKIVLSCDCDVALNASNTADLCLEVEYIVAE